MKYTMYIYKQFLGTLYWKIILGYFGATSYIIEWIILPSHAGFEGRLNWWVKF